jgi:DNA gyrase/topoisomerase IV subunit B
LQNPSGSNPNYFNSDSVLRHSGVQHPAQYGYRLLRPTDCALSRYGLRLIALRIAPYRVTFFNSKDYLQIARYANDTAGMFNEGSYMQMGERQQPVSSFKQAFEWMMKEIKKGQHIQRYKGLGEMNPEQLWETTLDANNRRLLQVRIEDVIAADEIFTTLMGDVVEPRRDFIVKNALDVTNLDV